MSTWPVSTALTGLCALLGAGCQATPRAQSPVTQRAWREALTELAALRSTAPSQAYTEEIRVAMHEPRTGRVLEGRGAVAVDPGRAVRLVLLGPGGRTALDVWVTRSAWRFSIPAIDLTRRGRTGEGTADLPVGFFRWWFLEPLDGRLLTVLDDGRSRTFVLRDEAATVLLRRVPRPTTSAVRHFIAVRREESAVDRLEWVARELVPGRGDRARYEQRTTGLTMEILVEGISPEPPDPAAFLDPDELGVPL